MKILNNYKNIWLMLADIRNYTRENNEKVIYTADPINLQIGWYCDNMLWETNIGQLKLLKIKNFPTFRCVEGFKTITNFLNNEIEIPELNHMIRRYENLKFFW